MPPSGMPGGTDKIRGSFGRQRRSAYHLPMTTKPPSQLPADATIEQTVASITLPQTMQGLPIGVGGVVVSAIRTPCRAVCLHDTVYVGFHLVPSQMVNVSTSAATTATSSPRWSGRPITSRLVAVRNAANRVEKLPVPN